MDKLFAAGARDVWLTAIMMKKNRPGTQLSILADEQAASRPWLLLYLRKPRPSVCGFIQLNGSLVQRELVNVATRWGMTQVKVSSYQGQICNIAPEFEDCERVAEESALPVKTIWLDAMRVAGGLFPVAEDKEK